MVYHAINNFVLKKHRKCIPIHTFAGYSYDQCEYKVTNKICGNIYIAITLLCTV